MLISKEKEEKKVAARLRAIKQGKLDFEQVTRLDGDASGNQGEVILYADGQAEDSTDYDLKNVIYQRDNLKERLKAAHEEIEQLRRVKKEMEIQLIDEDDLAENLKQYGQAMRPSTLSQPNSFNLTVDIENTA